MFTGIVQGIGRVVAIETIPGMCHLEIALPSTAGLQPGASVAINGVCLTVTRVEGEVARFDVIAETLARTMLGRLAVGDGVNVERAARFGEEIGGHLLSGHVAGVATVRAVEPADNNLTLRIAPPPELSRFLFYKGYVGVHGCSLTLGEITPDGTFAVHLIPETLRLTVLGRLQPGDPLHIEVDPLTQAVVETTERVLAARGDRA